MISETVSGKIILKPKRAQPFFNRHPWVFAGAIDRIEGEPADGAVVDLESATGSFVARGLFNGRSKIRVRLFSWDEAEALDRDFFRRKLVRALALRHDVLKRDDGPDAAYRAVFSEADGLPGLIVDRFGDWLAMQVTSLALHLREGMLAELLAELTGCRGIYRKNERNVNKIEGFAPVDGLAWGEAPPSEIVIREGPLRFAVNLTEGQKTGFYLDQRENHALVAGFAKGRRVLDAFCYAGGFGLACATAGASEVECIDASETAILAAIRNAELNGLSGIAFEKSDVFERLEALVQEARQFDLVVLDPPKFARDRASLPQALRGYRRLLKQALQLLATDGILVMCCCTGLISLEMLEDVIAQSAAAARREVQFLERRGPSADHPVSAFCREGDYLKCIVMRVG